MSSSDESDNAAAEAPDSADEARVSEEEVDALLEGVESGHIASEQGTRIPGEVNTYDLVAPDHITRGRMPALDRVNERWVGTFQRRLVEIVPGDLQVSAEATQILRYGEWRAALPGSTVHNLLGVTPPGGSALVAAESRLLFNLVDQLYGGGAVSSDAIERAPTPTEQRLNDVVVDALCKEFLSAFKPVASLEFDYQRSDVNPDYVTIATPSESIVVIRLQISSEETSVGQLDLVLPLALMEPMRERLDEGLKTASPQSRQRWQSSLKELLGRMDLELRSIFVETSLSVADLMRLKPGDVLPIEMPKTAQLVSGERRLMSGKFGRSRGYNAIKVIDFEAGTPTAKGPST